MASALKPRPATSSGPVKETSPPDYLTVSFLESDMPTEVSATVRKASPSDAEKKTGPTHPGLFPNLSNRPKPITVTVNAKTLAPIRPKRKLESDMLTDVCAPVPKASPSALKKMTGPTHPGLLFPNLANRPKPIKVTVDAKTLKPVPPKRKYIDYISETTNGVPDIKALKKARTEAKLAEIKGGTQDSYARRYVPPAEVSVTPITQPAPGPNRPLFAPRHREPAEIVQGIVALPQRTQGRGTFTEADCLINGKRKLEPEAIDAPSNKKARVEATSKSQKPSTPADRLQKVDVQSTTATDIPSNIRGLVSQGLIIDDGSGPRKLFEKEIRTPSEFEHRVIRDPSTLENKQGYLRQNLKKPKPAQKPWDKFMKANPPTSHWASGPNRQKPVTPSQVAPLRAPARTPKEKETWTEVVEPKTPDMPDMSAVRRVYGDQSVFQVATRMERESALNPTAEEERHAKINNHEERRKMEHNPLKVPSGTDLQLCGHSKRCCMCDEKCGMWVEMGKKTPIFTVLRCLKGKCGYEWVAQTENPKSIKQMQDRAVHKSLKAWKRYIKEDDKMEKEAKEKGEVWNPRPALALEYEGQVRLGDLLLEDDQKRKALQKENGRAVRVVGGLGLISSQDLKEALFVL